MKARQSRASLVSLPRTQLDWHQQVRDKVKQPVDVDVDVAVPVGEYLWRIKFSFGFVGTRETLDCSTVGLCFTYVSSVGTISSLQMFPKKTQAEPEIETFTWLDFEFSLACCARYCNELS